MSNSQDQRERLELLGQMTAGVVHDVRNMVGTLSLSLECAARLAGGGPADASTERCLRIIENIDSMLESVLELARPGCPVKRLDLGSLAHQTLRMLGQSIRMHQVRLDTSIQEGLWVEGRGAELCQSLSNLILNACQAMQDNDGPRRLSVTTRSRGLFVEIVVEDTGPGVDEVMKPTVFDAFATSKPTGTGLGLWNCRRIAEEHGGEMQVENRSEGGARFRLVLPAAGMVGLPQSA